MGGKLVLILLDFSSEKIRTLHFTWLAFFLTFFVWFNHAPLGAVIAEEHVAEGAAGDK